MLIDWIKISDMSTNFWKEMNVMKVNLCNNLADYEQESCGSDLFFLLCVSEIL